MDHDADLSRTGKAMMLAYRCFVIAEFCNSCTARRKNNTVFARKSGKANIRFVPFAVEDRVSTPHVYMQYHRLRNHRARKPSSFIPPPSLGTSLWQRGTANRIKQS